MHRTIGDSFGTSGGKNIFRQESPGSFDATQGTFDTMNALQEEIANVVTAEGFSLNSSAETIAQMIQLNTAIDKKVTDEATARTAAIVTRVPDLVGGTDPSGHVFDTDQGVVTVNGAFRYSLQRIVTPEVVVHAAITFRFPVGDVDYKWVSWQLPATVWRPASSAPQSNIVVPATAVLWDSSETPKQSAQTPMYAAVMRRTAPSTVDVIMFGGAELMEENPDTLPTQVAFTKPVAADANDDWYVSCNIMYVLS